MPPDEKKRLKSVTAEMMTGREAIHSGHFMVSDIDEVVEVSSPHSAVHESDGEQDVPTEELEQVFEASEMETSKTYTCGTQILSIDASLTKLFECMSLAYSGKLTSPRWKTFKGLKLRLKEKIRMNNIIWRAWHIQFVARRKPPVCQFATPLDAEAHIKPESVILEGKYWKRRLAAVSAEYQKWRMFYKDQSIGPQDSSDFMEMDYKFPSWPSGPLSGVDDDYYMDFTDTLFSTLLPQQSYDLCNQREIARAGIADFMQPGLVQLQPTVDDFMDTFEPLHDFLLSRLPPLPEESPMPDSSSMLPPTTTSRFNPLRPLSSAVEGNFVSPSLPDSSEQLDLKSSIEVLSQSVDPATIFGFQPQMPKMQSGFPAAVSSIPPDVLPATSTTSVPIRASLLGLDAQDELLLPFKNQASKKHANIIASGVKGAKSKPQPATKTDTNRRHSHTGVGSRKTAPDNENDAQFAVPKVQSKPRIRSRSVSTPQNTTQKVTPTPSPSVSLTNISISPPPLLPNTPRTTVQNAVLAQLLTSGTTFSRAGISTVTKTSANTSPTVAIISSVPTTPVNTSLHTLVFSPLTLATVSGVNDISRGLLLGSSSTAPSVVQKPSPASPCNSTASSPGQVTETSTPPPLLQKPFRPKSSEERVQYKEHRRVCHINAEQKRRYNIKNGFQLLNQLLPSLCHSPNAKVTKAAMLQKTADYIRTLKAERRNQQEEAEHLKKQIESLNKAISNYQNQLPSTGAPVPCQRSNYMKDTFDDYVRRRTLASWKFWIFSLMMEPLLESFASCVTTSSIEEMCKSVLAWIEQHCSLTELRPVVLTSLRHLSTSTNILSNPASLSDEAIRAVTKKELILP